MFGVALVVLLVRDAQGRPSLRGMLTVRGGLGLWCGGGWLYTVIFERTAVLQATLGKVVMNVRVESLGGGPVRAHHAAVRNALRIVDLQPCLLYLVGAVSARRSPLRQRVGDRATDCVVVRHRFPAAGRVACLVLLMSPVAAATVAVHRYGRARPS